MKKRREASWIRFYLGVLTWVLFGCNAGHAASLVWNPNPPEDDIVFYTVYIDSVLGSSQVNVTETRFSLNDLPLGVAFTIRVTATASSGLESLPSSIEYFGVVPGVIAPAITVQPESTDVLIGNPFTVDVGVGGTAPFAYQWFKEGVAMDGGTAASLSVSSASSNHAGIYHVVVANSAGSAQSANATVRVIPHIVITQQPTNQNVAPGAALTLAAQASSVLPLSYQWLLDDEELEGEAGPVLQRSQVTYRDVGAYRVLVSNELETISSATAEITIVLDADTSKGRLSITATAAGVDLAGQGEPGATYDVQLCGDLSSQNWITIQAVVADQSGRFKITAPLSGRSWFIRTSKQ